MEVTVSEAIVPFRETIIEPPKTDMVNELIENQQQQPSNDTKKSSLKENVTGTIVQKTANKKCTIKIRAAPLPLTVTEILEKSLEILTVLKENENLLKAGKLDALSEVVQDEIAELKDKLADAFEKDGWDPGTVNRIWSFGPKKCGPNILINEIKDYTRGCIWPINLITGLKVEDLEKENSLNAFDSTFVNGFQLATLAGPLCEEPMVGIAFIVEDWTIESDDSNDNLNLPFGPFSGQIMSTVKDSCRKAFQAQPQRLMVAMYSCSIQVNSEVLGKNFFYFMQFLCFKLPIKQILVGLNLSFYLACTY